MTKEKIRVKALKWENEGGGETPPLLNYIILGFPKLILQNLSRKISKDKSLKHSHCSFKKTIFVPEKKAEVGEHKIYFLHHFNQDCIHYMWL